MCVVTALLLQRFPLLKINSTSSLLPNPAGMVLPQRQTAELPVRQNADSSHVTYAVQPSGVYVYRRFLTLKSFDFAHRVLTVPSHFFETFFLLFSHLRLDLPSGPFLSSFRTKTLYTVFFSSMHATCPVHLSVLHLIFDKQDTSWSFSLRSFPQSPVTPESTSAPYSRTPPAHFLPLAWQTTCHTHTKFCVFWSLGFQAAAEST